MSPSLRFPAVVTAVVSVLVASACGAPGPSLPPLTTGPLRPLASQSTAPDGALACPPTIADAQGMTVPALPQGLDGAARLLPARTPLSLVVCSYPVLDISTSTPLSSPYAVRQRTVPDAAVRARIVEALAWAPRGSVAGKVCTEMGGDETVHLVGARYGDAVVWVAAKADVNLCSGATNGDFTSRAAMGSVLEGVLGRRGPVGVSTGTCETATLGRLGDDRSLAPDGDPVVTVCRTRADGVQQATRLEASAGAEVVAALRSLPVRATNGTCEGAGSEPDRAFRLVLAHAAGPDVVVNVVPGCRPAVLGGGLEAEDADALAELVERWSPPSPGPGPDTPVTSTVLTP